MNKPRKNATAAAAVRQSRAVERLTGEWFCQSGAHYTKAARSTWRGRTICDTCKTRLTNLTKKASR